MAKQIPLDQILDNPFQPRQTFDKATLQSLADEMLAEGFWTGSLQGRRGENGRIELVFGHRRLRALRLLAKQDPENWGTVAIDVVTLSDAQMALRSLEENLQREGLTDLEKADGVKQAVEIAKASLREAGKSEIHAAREVADRLGLSREWIKELCEISVGIPTEKRGPVQAGHLSAVTAHRAQKWGGDAYVKTLTRQSKDGRKPSQTTVDRMKSTVEKAPEPVRAKLKEEVVSGKLTDPKQVEMRARTLSAQHTRRQKEPPPDLKDVIVGWTHRIRDWEKQMRDVKPYMDYVDEVPSIAKDFRAALTRFIDTANQLL